MRTATTAKIGLLVVGIGAIVWFALIEPEPSTATLDADIHTVQVQLGDAMASGAVAGGLVKTYADIRAETYMLTDAMLKAKRSSILRRINLNFTTEGQPLAPANEQTLKDIQSDIDATRQRVKEAEIDALQYTGGLAHSMSLATIEVTKLTEAQLTLAYYSAKYGVPFPKVPKSETPAPAPVAE